MTRLVRWAAALFALSVVPACADSVTIPLRFDDANPATTRFGKLGYLGGLHWIGGRDDFGGFSGMVLEDESLLALTDKGHWFRTAMQFDDEGHLSGLSGLEVGRFYRAPGVYLQRPYTDSEAIAKDGTGYLIAFERQHRVSRFDTPKAPARSVAGLPDLSILQTNRGIEAMLLLPDRRLILVAEEPPSGNGNHVGWIVDGDKSHRFAIRRVGTYSPTDMTLGPDGETVYLLERRYSVLGGPGMRIRRFPLSDIVPRAEIGGETLIDLGAGHAVDNMEAIAARAGPDGDELFVLSDDNFSARQRTLLLHFRVME